MRIMKTFLVLSVYCWFWQILELEIEGPVTNRLVDNLIMIMFIPVIYIAVGKD